MKIYKVIITALLPILLSACATSGGTAFTQSESGNAASIKGYSNREGAFTFDGCWLMSVDNKRISHGIFYNPPTVTTKIDPGLRKIVVFAQFKNGYFSSPFEVTIPMDVELKPATEYQLKEAVEGTMIEVWLELASTGEKASNTYKASYSRTIEPVLIRVPMR